MAPLAFARMTPLWIDSLLVGFLFIAIGLGLVVVALFVLSVLLPSPARSAVPTLPPLMSLKVLSIFSG